MVERCALLTPFVLFAVACTADSRQRVFIAGDSTASHYERKYAPQSGWGQALGFYLRDSIVVDNRASSGRSSKSFLAEGRWDDLVSDVRAGDVVLISFGHNDARRDSPRRFTTPDGEFRENLERFAREVRERKATAVILSPAARRLWEGPIMVRTHGLYASNAQIAARAADALFVDLSFLSLTYFEALGAEATKQDFLWLAPDTTRQRFAQGVEDNTHFSELGACGVARVIARALAAAPETAALVEALRIDDDPNGPRRPLSVESCAASLPRA